MIHFQSLSCKVRQLRICVSQDGYLKHETKINKWSLNCPDSLLVSGAKKRGRDCQIKGKSTPYLHNFVMGGIKPLKNWYYIFNNNAILTQQEAWEISDKGYNYFEIIHSLCIQRTVWEPISVFINRPLPANIVTKLNRPYNEIMSDHGCLVSKMISSFSICFW